MVLAPAFVTTTAEADEIDPGARRSPRRGLRGRPVNALLDRFAGPAREALPRLTPAERAVVHRELAELEHGGHGEGPLPDALREARRPGPGAALHRQRRRPAAHARDRRLGEPPEQPVVASPRAGLLRPRLYAEDDGRGGPADLIVGRGHIAPAFYAEHYVRGTWPFTPLATLHQGGLTGVVHRDLGFRNTMRYSLGVGVAQAVSLAWELTRRGEDRKVVCLAGDGELHEGAAFEALRFAHDAGLTNLVLVVDANAKGIEPLAKPVNTGYLAAYLEPPRRGRRPRPLGRRGGPRGAAGGARPRRPGVQDPQGRPQLQAGPGPRRGPRPGTGLLRLRHRARCSRRTGSAPDANRPSSPPTWRPGSDCAATCRTPTPDSPRPSPSA